MSVDFVKSQQSASNSTGSPTADGARFVRPGELICYAHELADGGRGIRFMLAAAGEARSAFVVRHAGYPYGYLNQCAHRALELDWMEGEFFDAQRRFLICASHGARYDPISGACIDGPCTGRALVRVPLELVGAEIRLGRDLSTFERNGGLKT